jgi:hypothetical protein
MEQEKGFGIISIPVKLSIGKASTCHTVRKKTKREVFNFSLLADKEGGGWRQFKLGLTSMVSSLVQCVLLYLTFAGKFFYISPNLIFS